MTNGGVLWVIPTPIGPGSRDFAPPEVLKEVEVVFCESERNAKRFFSSKGVSFKHVRFQEFRRLKSTNDVTESLKTARKFAIICDAGFPAVADAGSDIVYLAHSLKLDVRPLPGPNSLIMALAASGLNGNRFEFFGYPPIHPKELKTFLKKLEKLSERKSCVFIEAPQRSAKTYSACVEALRGDTILSVAINIDHSKQRIKTSCVDLHRQSPMKIDKEPAVFILGKPSPQTT